jgi:hypothetical protein
MLKFKLVAVNGREAGEAAVSQIQNAATHESIAQ